MPVEVGRNIPTKHFWAGGHRTLGKTLATIPAILVFRESIL